MDNHSLEVIELQTEYQELDEWYQFLVGSGECEEAIQVKKRMERIKRTLRNLT